MDMDDNAPAINFNWSLNFIPAVGEQHTGAEHHEAASVLFSQAVAVELVTVELVAVGVKMPRNGT
ncbi:hypothetical protein VC83_02861 [Pseudogymnoascus destructans]|uniref:Uncharacterized protein n=1 Tax=Pseudogymnoascus destructans TaxID=655981 RepID=A0A177AGM3_9PEZI|nr:uncharacterized protein VC83_02861 [Pseudogymnoascus destructans]OAF60314.1 hypothetical protein VC83_02861 [Pseudogymnoascus destructans]